MKYLIILIAVFVSGCKTNGHKEFYQGYDLDELPLEMKQNMEFLSPTEEPAIYRSNNIQRDFEDLLSKRYIRIGHSRFNGGYEPIENIIKQAKSVGAVVVLTTSNYTNHLKIISNKLFSQYDKKIGLNRLKRSILINSIIIY